MSKGRRLGSSNYGGLGLSSPSKQMDGRVGGIAGAGAGANRVPSQGAADIQTASPAKRSALPCGADSIRVYARIQTGELKSMFSQTIRPRE